MLQLGVNIDHVATLRQARGTTYPGLVEAAACCVRGGAVGLTIHLREDRRHIQDADVHALKAFGQLPLNLEMATAPDVLEVALAVRPEEVCLVPERRQELTTEGGLDAAGHREELAPVVEALSGQGAQVSLFIDPEERQVDAAVALGAPCIELHTGCCCDAPDVETRERETRRLITAARYAHQAGLQVNAGHGINLDNLGDILRVPHLVVLNIGHSLVARAVFVGLEAAVREMHTAMADYQGGDQP